MTVPSASGDFCALVGVPPGADRVEVYDGIVSAVGRSGLGIEGFENFIQTDASINPGNSGGALVTTQGELVGINTAIVGPSGGNVGIGFAIPSNMAQAVMVQLVEHGEVRRGQLGVAIQELTPELAAAFGLKQPGGAVIAEVIPGSAADRAGLVAGDIVVAVNGKPIGSGSALRNAIGLERVGDDRLGGRRGRAGDRGALRSGHRQLDHRRPHAHRPRHSQPRRRRRPRAAGGVG